MVLHVQREYGRKSVREADRGVARQGWEAVYTGSDRGSGTLHRRLGVDESTNLLADAGAVSGTVWVVESVAA